MTIMEVLPELITIAAAAEKLGVTPTVAYKMAARGDLPTVVIGRVRRVSVRMLEWRIANQIAEAEARETIEMLEAINAAA